MNFNTYIPFFLKKIVKKTPLWYVVFAFYYVHNLYTLKKYNGSLTLNREADEPLLEKITSQLPTAFQCFEPKYTRCCVLMRTFPRLNRKQWEYVYILEALKSLGQLEEGKRGLGFGCGREPIPSILARHGCLVTATDQATDQADRHGWVSSGMHSASLAALNRLRLCPEEVFQKRASFRTVDMNTIPDDLVGFDFLWSSCALEHLGSLEHGLAFIRRVMGCLKPGGIAVHTTEFNLSSDSDTFESAGLCIYRQQDILRLAGELQNCGHTVMPFNFCAGKAHVDDYVAKPPYQGFPHLKILLEGYTATSIGIIIRKAL